MVVGIDASRNRSGGAKAHLIGILSAGSPEPYGVQEVHVWAYKSLLDSLPDHPWLIKHNPEALERSLPWQVLWQRFRFPGELKRAGCAIVLNTDAGTVGRFQPSVTMSRDMLSYEPGEMGRYGASGAFLRLLLLRYLQSSSLRKSNGVVFLTRYAAEVIQQHCGLLPSVALIPHGIAAEFKEASRATEWPRKAGRALRCLYVSNVAPYKHQWAVVKAMRALRQRGHDVTLTLVGGGRGPAQRKLEAQLAVSDPARTFVRQVDFVSQQELLGHLKSADLFVFASSCENMPNTLVEAMTVGLPIACSDRGPMPEVLEDGGVYFDPEDDASIAGAIERIIEDRDLRERITRRAKTLAGRYSWPRCAKETWEFVVWTCQSAYKVFNER